MHTQTGTPSLVASRFRIRTRAGSPSALNRSAVASASASDRPPRSWAQQSTASSSGTGGGAVAFVSMSVNVSSDVDTCRWRRAQPERRRQCVTRCASWARRPDSAASRSAAATSSSCVAASRCARSRARVADVGRECSCGARSLLRSVLRVIAEATSEHRFPASSRRKQHLLDFADRGTRGVGWAKGPVLARLRVLDGQRGYPSHAAPARATRHAPRLRSRLAVAARRGSEPIVLPQDAMPGRLLVGLQDDPSFRWGADRAAMLDGARDANASVLRTVVVEGHRSDPADERCGLLRSRVSARRPRRSRPQRQQRGIEVLITIWGTPSGRTEIRRRTVHRVIPRTSKTSRGARRPLLGSARRLPRGAAVLGVERAELEQFLAPQFDGAGRSVGPALYAPLARAIYDGVKRGNPDAQVAIGETSPRGHDVPTGQRVQDSHSPARFARLLSEVRPAVRLDAWARCIRIRRGPTSAPRSRCGGHASGSAISNASAPRWTSGSDGTARRSGSPSTRTRRVRPSRSGSIRPLQARYAAEALELAAENPRVRMFVWFVFRDPVDGLWQSGLLSTDGSPKPALETFTVSAQRLDGRDPVLPENAEVARVSALELAYYVPVGRRSTSSSTANGSQRCSSNATAGSRCPWTACPATSSTCVWPIRTAMR